MSGLTRLIEALELSGSKGRGKAWQCPAHPDRSPSLSIDQGDKGAVLECKAGCQTPDVLAAIGLTMADLFDEPLAPRERPRVVAEYPYADEQGEVLYLVRRIEPGYDGEPKTFRQYRPDGTAGVKGIRRVLYRLPEVLAQAQAGRTVLVVEGEKDADNLAHAGTVATCNVGGAGKWNDDYTASLLGASEVVVIADRDEPGRKHAAAVAESVSRAGIPVRIMQPAKGKDVSDHLAAGLGYGDLLPVELDQQETATPPPAQEWPEGIPRGDLTPEEAAELARVSFEREVDAEARRLRVKQEAARRVRQDREASEEEPELIRLDDFLAIEDEPTAYRIEGLWPVGGRILPAAQYKAGKTTLVANLIRALVDGEDFLGTFAVNQPEGRVILIDNELDQSMMRRWLRDQKIVNTDRVAVLSLRGKLATFDILDPDTRARWAAKIRAAEGSVVMLDCLRPVFDALGLDENREAGRFLVAFDSMLSEAGASEAAVIHHMGHVGERSRGDSRLLDWPDVSWRLVREKSNDPTEVNPEAPRYFSAYGRDVNVPEGLLEYDPASRRLHLVGGSRRDAQVEKVMPDLFDFLRLNPGASKNAVEQTLAKDGSPHTQKDVRRAVDVAVTAGKVQTARGPRRATLCSLTSGVTKNEFVSSSPLRQRGRSEFVSSSIDDELNSRSDRGTSPDELKPQSKDGDLGLCEVCLTTMTMLTPDQTRHLECAPRGGSS